MEWYHQRSQEQKATQSKGKPSSLHCISKDMLCTNGWYRCLLFFSERRQLEVALSLETHKNFLHQVLPHHIQLFPPGCPCLPQFYCKLYCCKFYCSNKQSSAEITFSKSPECGRASAQTVNETCTVLISLLTLENEDSHQFSLPCTEKEPDITVELQHFLKMV